MMMNVRIVTSAVDFLPCSLLSQGANLKPGRSADAISYRHVSWLMFFESQWPVLGVSVHIPGMDRDIPNILAV